MGVNPLIRGDKAYVKIISQIVEKDNYAIKELRYG